MQNSAKVDIGWGACIFFSMVLLTFPLQWCAAFFFASVFHELCHVAAVVFCGGKISNVRIGPAGAVINASGLKPLQAVLCSLAGPMGGLIPVLFFRRIPRIAVCAFLQSTYNLLPLYPLDGWNALTISMGMFWGDARRDRLSEIVQVITCIFLSMMVLRFFCGITAVAVLVILWMKIVQYKNTLQSDLSRGTMVPIKMKRYGYDRITAENPARRAETRTVYRRRI